MVRTFGEIAGLAEGTIFPNRTALSASGVHPPTQAGISYSATDGADSIVISGGYEDDEDYGDVIIYTGHGGRDSDTGQQTADQDLQRGNLALARNCTEGLPLRVTRGSAGDPAYSPPTGYRYEGLFMVESYSSEIGRSGFRVLRFKLRKVDRTATLPTSETIREPADRLETTVQRIVRTTATAGFVKELHDHRCQMCGTRLETSAGPYAEAAHIRPLGRPHDGPDVVSNILCLCPNCHVLFDRGAITLTDRLGVQRSGVSSGTLQTHRRHEIAVEHVKYQRALWE